MAAELPRADVRLPHGEALAEVLLDLAVAHEDINPVVGAREQLGADPVLAELLERCVRTFVRDMGVVGGGPQLGPRLPALPSGTGPAGHWFALLVFAATVRHTLAFHLRRGIPAEVSRRTFADVGRQCAVHYRRHGTPGIVNTSWLTRHFRGVLYHLGRLQYERTRLGGRTGRAVAEAGGPAGPGDLSLNVHIPDFSGPLTPVACDESVERARAFFARHFSDGPHTVATCHSWLLDPQLAERLPAGSNIVRFQRRFRLLPVGEAPDDDAPLRFVFGTSDRPLSDLPRVTALQRAVTDHLMSGGHWYGGTGWFAL
ncbi:DUF5596 domain-containing protein [Streptomyces sp. KK5PA1]|uniref:DUF5596 domain-containing protein n=2 Tax=Actinacidiphila acididurans TaxID=2784346 RepID=A0ABS2U5B0_9ACTN|nr:DUF5596 domain-containing protein [Actinacidiphila acididurans]